MAIFASGAGTNALNICNYFADNAAINVSLLVSNNAQAKVIERLKPFNVEVILINKNEFKKADALIIKLQKAEIDLIVLAGFLWLIPDKLIEAFKGSIINLHPSLLPKYGGKGMYGLNVHKAVLAANEKESGITIHYVNEVYDEGEIIFKASTKVANNETPESLAQKIHLLEYEHFPKVIEVLLMDKS